MHNKTWIADNRVAVAGGRNLGNEYFGASDAGSFVDLDFAVIGPIVRDASASFDRYWNSPSAYPIGILDSVRVNAQALAAHRVKLDEAAAAARTSRYANALRADAAVQRLATGDWPMQWSAHYQFVADDPQKVTMRDQDLQRAQVRRTLLRVVQTARTDLVLTSPYFVLGEGITTLLRGTVKNGTRTLVLTNSLLPTTSARSMAGIRATEGRSSKAVSSSGN